uniref:RING-type domain-containing protein n=1 Tax=Cynoglossus semilaevis TaxID=244447 RepID=A0A3P8WKI5_CYNSE
MLPFEVAGGDVVKHRIQTGVKGDEGHGDPAGDEDLVGGGATLDDIHSSEKVQQIHNMVGQEAEQRDGQDGVDDPHRPLGCFGLDQGDSPRSQWVTHQDDERGQQRAEDETEHGVCPQARVPLVFGKVLKACSSSVLDKADRCYICLSLFKDQSVGSLPNCRHFFCFECILQWSQTANTCPVDRTSFDFIHQRQRPGGAIQNKIKVQSKKEETEVEEPTGGAVHCDECGRSDRRRQMLVCIHCDSGCEATPTPIIE